jgi:2-alkyl-3-oxoalkanoate reductase
MTDCVLITGATGGLGVGLVSAARAQGLAVLATGRSDRHKARIEGMGAAFAQGDLLDKSFVARMCKGQTGVIHAAALSQSWGPRASFEAANIVVTENLLQAAKRAGAERFVFVSSPSIFAKLADQIGIKDIDLPNPRPLNYYAQTKLIAERRVMAASEHGFATVAIRPRAIVGPDDQVLLPRLAELARRKTMPLPRGGEALIELTDVRDASSAILSAYQRAPVISGQAFNISGGRPLPVKTIATRLSQALGTNPKHVAIPLVIGVTLAWLLETQAHLINAKTEPVLTLYTLATLAFSQTFDLSVAKQALGWSPQYSGLESLLEQARRGQP